MNPQSALSDSASCAERVGRADQMTGVQRRTGDPPCESPVEIGSAGLLPSGLVWIVRPGPGVGSIPFRLPFPPVDGRHARRLIAIRPTAPVCQSIVDFGRAGSRAPRSRGRRQDAPPKSELPEGGRCCTVRQCR